jgi:hypothetical protein
MLRDPSVEVFKPVLLPCPDFRMIFHHRILIDGKGKSM